MLKKAGIVVVGAAAGVLSMSSVAFAGEANTASADDSGHSHSHHDGDDNDRGSRGGSCDKIAASGGGNVIDASNLASNLDLSHVNILGADNSHEHGCRGGGDKAALSGGGNVLDASNLLSNADIKHLNVLGSDNSES